MGVERTSLQDMDWLNGAGMTVLDAGLNAAPCD